MHALISYLAQQESRVNMYQDDEERILLQSARHARRTCTCLIMCYQVWWRVRAGHAAPTLDHRAWSKAALFLHFLDHPPKRAQSLALLIADYSRLLRSSRGKGVADVADVCGSSLQSLRDALQRLPDLALVKDVSYDD